jgi:hypothetical protein
VLIEIDDGPDRVDLGGRILLAILPLPRLWRPRLSAPWSNSASGCLRRCFRGLPVTERTDL